MKKIKLVLLGIFVIGTMAGCADKTEVSADIEVTKTTEVETTTEEETSTAEETTTIEETTVAEAATIEIDDTTYNTEQIKSFGIREDDAKAAAEFLDRISFGKIDASRRDDKSASPRYEISNSDGIVYYLVIKDNTIKEILNIKGEFIIKITEEPVPVETPKTTDNQSSPNGEAPVEESKPNTSSDIVEFHDDSGPNQGFGSVWGKVNH